jgi:hypothetical protein
MYDELPRASAGMLDWAFSISSEPNQSCTTTIRSGNSSYKYLAVSSGCPGGQSSSQKQPISKHSDKNQRHQQQHIQHNSKMQTRLTPEQYAAVTLTHHTLTSTCLSAVAAQVGTTHPRTAHG